MKYTGKYLNDIKTLRRALDEADAVVIGAGAGLSTSAGYVYSGERFQRYFHDFAAKYGFKDMYSGGFYVMELEPEVSWAFWARNIYINRYVMPPKPVYEELLALVREKDYFVITTNVDHCFQRAGFDKKRLFYTQGDYGLFQSVNPELQKTFDNESWVMAAMEAQGFVRDMRGIFVPPENGALRMSIPTELIPRCPEDGSEVTMNLRSDDSFVEDEGWHRAAERYSNFLRTRGGRVLFLELGVGYNTPGIIKYPFWRMTAQNPQAAYACLNCGDASCPPEIKKRSICLDGDIGEILQELK
ncbi:MAG: hypothetical protein II794_00500 [Oscillospiraceae bacterium]|nr:hypothetical protein [Oscillospiraceae bacterium]